MVPPTKTWAQLLSPSTPKAEILAVLNAEIECYLATLLDGETRSTSDIVEQFWPIELATGADIQIRKQMYDYLKDEGPDMLVPEWRRKGRKVKNSYGRPIHPWEWFNKLAEDKDGVLEEYAVLGLEHDTDDPSHAECMHDASNDHRGLSGYGPKVTQS
jgi:hypothetical protein